MRRGDNLHKDSTSDGSQSVDSILEADALIEAELSRLERMLERKEDASLELGKLRELRQSCGRIKELIGKFATASAARVQAPR